MRQSVEILNVFNTLRQIFRKTNTFFKKRECHILVKSTEIENASFPFPFHQKPMLRQIEWQGQN